jgi:SAM-dependent methyltransferase
LEAIDFPDGHFAAILCRNVLDFVPAPGRMLTEFWRLLRPGGRLALAVLGAASIVKREDWRRFLPDSPTPAIRNQLLPWEAEALLHALGWDIVEQFPSFAPSVAGVPNPYTPEMAARLQDRLLQQTVASSWWFVATKPTG